MTLTELSATAPKSVCFTEAFAASLSQHRRPGGVIALASRGNAEARQTVAGAVASSTAAGTADVVRREITGGRLLSIPLLSRDSIVLERLSEVSGFTPPQGGSSNTSDRVLVPGDALRARLAVGTPVALFNGAGDVTYNEVVSVSGTSVTLACPYTVVGSDLSIGTFERVELAMGGLIGQDAGTVYRRVGSGAFEPLGPSEGLNFGLVYEGQGFLPAEVASGHPVHEHEGGVITGVGFSTSAEVADAERGYGGTAQVTPILRRTVECDLNPTFDGDLRVVVSAPNNVRGEESVNPVVTVSGPSGSRTVNGWHHLDGLARQTGQVLHNLNPGDYAAAAGELSYAFRDPNVSGAGEAARRILEPDFLNNPAAVGPQRKPTITVNYAYAQGTVRFHAVNAGAAATATLRNTETGAVHTIQGNDAPLNVDPGVYLMSALPADGFGDPVPGSALVTVHSRETTRWEVVYPAQVGDLRVLTPGAESERDTVTVTGLNGISFTRTISHGDTISNLPAGQYRLSAREVNDLIRPNNQTVTLVANDLTTVTMPYGRSPDVPDPPSSGSVRFVYNIQYSAMSASEDAQSWVTRNGASGTLRVAYRIVRAPEGEEVMSNPGTGLETQSNSEPPPTIDPPPGSDDPTPPFDPLPGTGATTRMVNYDYQVRSGSNIDVDFADLDARIKRNLSDRDTLMERRVEFLTPMPADAMNYFQVQPVRAGVEEHWSGAVSHTGHFAAPANGLASKYPSNGAWSIVPSDRSVVQINALFSYQEDYNPPPPPGDPGSPGDFGDPCVLVRLEGLSTHVTGFYDIRPSDVGRAVPYTAHVTFLCPRDNITRTVHPADVNEPASRQRFVYANTLMTHSFGRFVDPMGNGATLGFVPWANNTPVTMTFTGTINIPNPAASGGADFYDEDMRPIKVLGWWVTSNHGALGATVYSSPWTYNGVTAEQAERNRQAAEVQIMNRSDPIYGVSPSALPGGADSWSNGGASVAFRMLKTCHGIDPNCVPD